MVKKVIIAQKSLYPIVPLSLLADLKSVSPIFLPGYFHNTYTAFTLLQLRFPHIARLGRLWTGRNVLAFVPLSPKWSKNRCVSTNPSPSPPVVEQVRTTFTSLPNPSPKKTLLSTSGSTPARNFLFCSRTILTFKGKEGIVVWANVVRLTA